MGWAAVTSEPGVGNDAPWSGCLEAESNLFPLGGKKNTQTRELEADNGFAFSFVTSAHVNVRGF